MVATVNVKKSTLTAPFIDCEAQDIDDKDHSNESKCDGNDGRYGHHLVAARLIILVIMCKCKNIGIPRS